MGSLSCGLPTEEYVYEVILIYSSFPILYSQLASKTIQRVAEVFIKVTSLSILVWSKAGPNQKYPPTNSFLCTYVLSLDMVSSTATWRFGAALAIRTSSNSW